MSKVDMSVFEEIRGKLGLTMDMDELVVKMADGDFDPYPAEILERARDKAEEATGLPKADLWSRNTDRDKRQEFRKVAREVEDRLREEVGPVCNYEHIAQDDDGEAWAEYCEGVFKLNGKYYQVSWRYYPSSGYETCRAADTIREVTPQEKVVTVYN